MGEDLVIFWLIGIAPPNGLGAEKKNERKTKKSANWLLLLCLHILRFYS